MIILSNCLTETADEGCVKVACSLTKRILRRRPDTTVVTYERKPAHTDAHLTLNKLLLNRSLWSLLRQKKEPVLYIPFPARMIATALRVFVLSLFARHGLRVVLTMRFPCGFLEKMLLRMSRAEIVTLSREAYELYNEIVGDKAIYLKCGVDTNRFSPVDAAKKQQLREKYAVAPGKKVLTHVGHLKEGRNIRQLLSVSSDYHVFLVVSTLTENERDQQLRAELEARPNTTIIDTYLDNIEEIYQLSDVYLFPVVEPCNCIDVPLSAMEAASCGVPVVATKYGELRELSGREGFWFIESFQPDALNGMIDTAVATPCDSRASVMEYDWNEAVDRLLM